MKGIIAVAVLVAPSFACAQVPSLEQRVAAEIGQCVITRSSLAAENDALKARIAALEKKSEEQKQDNVVKSAPQSP